MALERRDMKEARLRMKAMSATVGSVGEGWRERKRVREDSSCDDVSLRVKRQLQSWPANQTRKKWDTYASIKDIVSVSRE